jgi:hypothetical protein
VSLQGFFAVKGDIGGIALLAQAPGDGIGQVFFIFRNKDAHTSL